MNLRNGFFITAPLLLTLHSVTLAVDPECGTEVTAEHFDWVRDHPEAYELPPGVRGSGVIYYVPLTFHIVRPDCGGDCNPPMGLDPSRLCAAVNALNGDDRVDLRDFGRFQMSFGEER